MRYLRLVNGLFSIFANWPVQVAGSSCSGKCYLKCYLPEALRLLAFWYLVALATNFSIID